MTEKKQGHAKEAEHEKKAQQEPKPKHTEGGSCGIGSEDRSKGSSCGC